MNEIQHAALPKIGTEGEIVNQVRLVRDSENSQHFGGLAAVTIDIVAMLFDFIFDDAHVPVAIKALLSRLQIPVLKVAMLNPGFFADRQHPTRRFLGSISGISIRWGNAVDENDLFYRKLAELVERIQNEFEEDIEVFGTVLAELEAFVEENENSENRPTQAAASLAMRQERQADALVQAERELQSFRTGQQIPALLDDFFDKQWMPVLQKIALTNKVGDVEWQAVTETMKDLAWSVEPKKAPSERLKLINLLPNLLSRINAGLDSIEAPAAKRQAFFDELVKYHSAALKGDTAPLRQRAPRGKTPSISSSRPLTGNCRSPAA